MKSEKITAWALNQLSPDEQQLAATTKDFCAFLNSELREESLARSDEQRKQLIADEPLSTFSIDVDTALYANVRRFLNHNKQPPHDAVRVEERINYFLIDEDGPAADSKQPFAVKAEMAACPWKPQHRLVRVHLKGRDIGNEQKPSNLVFLVDVSGKMSISMKVIMWPWSHMQAAQRSFWPRPMVRRKQHHRRHRSSAVRRRHAWQCGHQAGL